MKCKEISALMPDLAAGFSAASPEMNEHLKSCAPCRGQLEEFQRTMALLDQWQASEPSPYFDVRLMARIREEGAKPTGWLSWLRKPALAASLAVLMVMSVALFRTDAGYRHGAESGPVAALPGSAVGDLQALDKNSDLYSDFELLDDLQVQQDVSANP
jgi:predicted anti-sigma-YlaC factor YlaD